VNGFDFYFNPASVDPTESARVRSVLMDTLKVLEQGNVSAEALKQTGSPPPDV
jgi:hypothetical protein